MQLSWVLQLFRAQEMGVGEGAEQGQRGRLGTRDEEVGMFIAKTVRKKQERREAKQNDRLLQSSL